MNNSRAISIVGGKNYRRISIVVKSLARSCICDSKTILRNRKKKKRKKQTKKNPTGKNRQLRNPRAAPEKFPDDGESRGKFTKTKKKKKQRKEKLPRWFVKREEKEERGRKRKEAQVIGIARVKNRE